MRHRRGAPLCLSHSSGSPEFQDMEEKVCSIEGCNKRTRTRSSDLCRMHYHRLWRTGTTDKVDRMIAPSFEHSDGYQMIYVPDHPMARPGSNYAYEHRVVFHDEKGGGPHRCHWCSRWITGRMKLHVDHKDGNRANNAAANLVPACSGCNTNRSDPDRAQRMSSAVIISYDGITKSSSWWARRIGISRGSLMARIRNGWPLERALTEPRGKTGPRTERQLSLIERF